MQRNISKKTLLHCQVSARATAFSFLYGVVYGKADVAAAKADMNTVWQSNKVCRNFIYKVRAKNDVSRPCEGCDLMPSPWASK